jgi:NO-binding membrane sensor protein with MHYT domain
MLYVSWDPILIGISFVVAFIASFVALDSASKIFLPPFAARFSGDSAAVRHWAWEYGQCILLVCWQCACLS